DRAAVCLRRVGAAVRRPRSKPLTALEADGTSRLHGVAAARDPHHYPMSPTLRPTRTTNAGPIAALALLTLIWGYNWVVMKVALQYVGPMDFAVLRAVFGVVLLFGVMAMLGAPLRPKHIGKTFWLGVF